MPAEPLLVSENNRNRSLTGSPYFNLYLTKSHIIVVPLMNRTLDVVSSISFALFVLLVLGYIFGTAPASSSIALFFGIFVVSFVLKYAVKAMHVKTTRGLSLADVLERYRHFSAPYAKCSVEYHTNGATVIVGEHKLNIRTDEGKKLEETIARINAKGL